MKTKLKLWSLVVVSALASQAFTLPCLSGNFTGGCTDDNESGPFTVIEYGSTTYSCYTADPQCCQCTKWTEKLRHNFTGAEWWRNRAQIGYFNNSDCSTVGSITKCRPKNEDGGGGV